MFFGTKNNWIYSFASVKVIWVLAVMSDKFHTAGLFSLQTECVDGVLSAMFPFELTDAGEAIAGEFIVGEFISLGYNLLRVFMFSQ